MRTARGHHRRCGARMAVSCSSHPLLELVELGESVSVLRPAGELLGGDDCVRLATRMRTPA